MDAMEKKRYLTAMGRSVENMTAEELKTVDTAALAKEHAAKATKTREEAERKVRETARQLDYIVRAVRIEELARIKEGFELRIKEDRRRYEEEEVVEQASKAKDQWTADVADKMALGECSVFDYTSTFESMIMSARQIVHVKACEQDDQRAELEAEKGKLNRARSRKEEEIRKAEEARLAAEREEAERRAEEEWQRKEEERRARQEELERKERLRMEEQSERSKRADGTISAR
jgi:translation initiation factor 3 subunit A